MIANMIKYQAPISIVAGVSEVICIFPQSGYDTYVRGYVRFADAGTLTIQQLTPEYVIIKEDSTSLTGAGSVYYNLLIYGYYIRVIVRNTATVTQRVYCYVITA